MAITKIRPIEKNTLFSLRLYYRLYKKTAKNAFFFQCIILLICLIHFLKLLYNGTIKILCIYYLYPYRITSLQHE